MSAFPPRADMISVRINVRFVPIATSERWLAKPALVGLFLRLLPFRLHFLRAGLCRNRQRLGSLEIRLRSHGIDVIAHWGFSLALNHLSWRYEGRPFAQLLETLPHGL